MTKRSNVWQGTLSLMVLKTLHALGPLHGYGIARRIETTSQELLSINHGTLYPILLKLEQEGSIASEWGTSENNRRARYYRITPAGRRHLHKEEQNWATGVRTLLFQVDPMDLSTLAGADGAYVLLALLVSIRPAVSAMRVDLARMLRDE